MTTDQSQVGEDAAKWLADKLGAMEDALATLVEKNSFTENKDGGVAVGKLLEELYAMPGLSLERTSSAKFADHLVWKSTWKPTSDRRIALVGHLDTVFPPGTFEGYKRDGDLARGPGVLDMKGGLVVVAYALRALLETLGPAALPAISLVCVADEEVGSPEGQAVIANAIRGFDSCLVFEAGRKGDAIITRRKGTGAMTAVAHGKAAHAGNAHAEGKNAIWALARFVDRVQALTDYERGVSVNVGKFTGGESKNTVPDRAEALLDLRFETKADAEALIARIEEAAKTSAVPGTHIDLSGGIARMPLERTDASARLLESYGACARAVGLGAGEAALIGGGSDASTSGSMGIASIDGLGPRGIGFHTKDEQIERGTLVQKAQALARFLAACGVKLPV
jgi:glutamate carboxypeptidase